MRWEGFKYEYETKGSLVSIQIGEKEILIPEEFANKLDGYFKQKIFTLDESFLGDESVLG